MKLPHGVKASGPLARIVAPIVLGQIGSFLNDHPEALGKMGRAAFERSLAKRIINDLLCGDTSARMAAALACSVGATEGGAGGVLCPSAAGDVLADASPASRQEAA